MSRASARQAGLWYKQGRVQSEEGIKSLGGRISCYQQGLGRNSLTQLAPSPLAAAASEAGCSSHTSAAALQRQNDKSGQAAWPATAKANVSPADSS